MTDVISTAKPINLTTTKEINGAWFANMRILPDDYIEAENYVDIDGEEYVVKNLKKIKNKGKYYYDVVLYHNAIEELTASTIGRFYLTKSIEDLLDYILDGSGWTAGTCDIDEIIVLKTDRRTTRLEALTLLAEKCNGELYYHSKDKIVDIKRQIGTSTKLQLRYDKNCIYIKKEQDSRELVTRIYPFGPDNFEINSTILDNCEDEEQYTPSGLGTVESSTIKQNGSQGIQINSATLNETFIRDLGVDDLKNLSGHDLLKFWIYSDDDNTNGFTFGIGEAAYDEITVATGALEGGCWKEVELDLSGVADADKNEIRYIGFKNLTDDSVVVVFDSIRAFSDDICIDSANINNYDVVKEYVYNNSARSEKVQYEKVINPIEDTYSVLSIPNTNYGSEANLYVRNYPSPSKSYRTYVKFSLSEIPSGATIIGATLGFNVNYLRSYGAEISVYLADADWDEDTLTWNNQPATSGGVIDTLDGTDYGIMECSILSAVQSWYSGGDNYGIILKMDTVANKTTAVDSRESLDIVPYLKITYNLASNPSTIIIAAATDYLAEHDEPRLLYKVEMVDLSKVIENTWEDEEINLGDTARLYDNDLNLNVDVRIKKITKDLLNPNNTKIELANKAYNISDTEAKLMKQLKYAMPFSNDDKIILANTIQEGYLGSGVNQ